MGIVHRFACACSSALVIFTFAFWAVSRCTEGEGQKVVVEQIPGVPAPLPSGTPPPTFPEPPRLPEFVSFDRAEQDMLSHVSAKQEEDRPLTRFTDLCNRWNEGQAGKLDEQILAIDKALNHISTERRIVKTVSADPTGCIRAFELDWFGLTPSKWRLIERFDETNAFTESFTQRGITLKQITQTRRPRISVEALIHAALGTRDVQTKSGATVRLGIYYQMLELPGNIREVFFDIGFDPQLEFDQRDVILAGGNRSRIAQQKNRLIQLAEARDGQIMSTFDINNAGQGGQGDLFEFPFPIEARSARLFLPQAQEHIYTLNNGCLGMVLNGFATGDLEFFAPNDIVVNTAAVQHGLPSDIDVGYECFECHSDGVIDYTDSIRDNCLANQNFSQADRERCEDLFKPAGVLTAEINRGKREYTERCLAPIGITNTRIEHVAQVMNEYRKEWGLRKLASAFFMTEDQMRACINSSPEAKTRLNAVLNGELVSKQTVIDVGVTLQQDCNIFQE